MSEQCTQAEKLGTLIKGYEMLEVALVDIRGDLKDVKVLLNSRPSWSVTIIISLLSTICASLIVYIAASGL